MNYIVFDLEWNQCPYGKGQENERIPFEIIEIGAVKLNSERQIIDQYQVLIQPRVYKKLHHRTREIIQMDETVGTGRDSFLPCCQRILEMVR